MQQYLIAKAQDILMKKDAQHLAVPYDDSKKIDHFPIGSYVLLDYNPTALRERPASQADAFQERTVASSQRGRFKVYVTRPHHQHTC